jgi:hypothetical protein
LAFATNFSNFYGLLSQPVHRNSNVITEPFFVSAEKEMSENGRPSLWLWFNQNIIMQRCLKGNNHILKKMHLKCYVARWRSLTSRPSVPLSSKAEWETLLVLETLPLRQTSFTDSSPYGAIGW